MSSATEGADLPLASVRAPYGGATCRRCKRPIIWLLTAANGRRLPVDRIPTTDGTVEVLAVSFGEPVARLHADPPPAGHVRYRVHFPSCKPRPRGWRARR